MTGHEPAEWKKDFEDCLRRAKKQQEQINRALGQMKQQYEELERMKKWCEDYQKRFEQEM